MVVEDPKDSGFESGLFTMTVVVVIFSLVLGSAAILIPAKKAVSVEIEQN